MLNATSPVPVSGISLGFFCPNAKLRRWAMTSFCVQFENPLESKWH